METATLRDSLQDGVSAAGGVRREFSLVRQMFAHKRCCWEEKVACSGNRQRCHTNVRRLADSTLLRRAQARWQKRPHDAQ